MIPATPVPTDLCSTYNGMSDKFLNQGLNLSFISLIRERYRQEGTSGNLSPIQYSHFPVPLGPNTVRLIVIPIYQASQQLVAKITLLCAAFNKVLPQGMEVYTNVPERWHITVFHTSQFDDTRPHPLKPVEPDLQRSEPAQHVMPTSANLQQEQETVQMVVSKSQPLVLEVCKVLLADSGTLLVCLTDSRGQLAQLRQNLKGAFPGAPSRQTQIVHVSVLRLLTAEQLSKHDRHALQAVCNAFTDRLKGMQITAAELWYVCESVFSNIEGTVLAMNTASVR
ncbi:hypothetical protein ABBQ38_007553 [Trebouxia sp. C0009 RCD-2024]